jgi:hypothetical protein
LGWTVQRPQRQAKERDEEAVKHWVAHEWPRIKRGASRISLDRLLRRVGHLADPTGAPHLVTPQPHPILRHPMAWTGLHGCCPRLPPRRHPRPAVLHLQADSYDTDSLIKVLEQLAGFFRGQRVVLWDGLSSHWSHKVRAHLEAQRHWLGAPAKPGPAPDASGPPARQPPAAGA